MCVFLIIRRLPRSTLTDTLVPCTTLVRSHAQRHQPAGQYTQGNNEQAVDRHQTTGDYAIADGRRLALRLVKVSHFDHTQIIERTDQRKDYGNDRHRDITRSEEHTSELQSLMRNSYAVFCLKKKKRYTT